MSFGKKIAYLRTNREISQNSLAKVLNVSRPTISLYETDDREPTKDTLLKIAKYFKVSVDYLIDDDCPINYNESVKYYETKFGPLDSLVEEDIQHIKTLIELLNKKNSK